MKTYLVGGAIRDELLGLPVKERDWVVVGSTPEEMLRAGYRQVGKDFPVFIHPANGEEYALARTERKTAKGHRGFTFNTDSAVTLEEDLYRRDLTINAIARDESGRLFDPHGGRSDIEARVLRHVSGAFIEDPLRVLRVARFAAQLRSFGFTVADETLSLMTTIANSGELLDLSAERVWGETRKSLQGPSPRTYFEVLRDCGALAVLFPEVNQLFGVPQRADYHPEVDTGLHTLMALDAATHITEDAAVRYAVLVHDLGKGITPEDILPRHIGHENTGVPLTQVVSKRLKVPARYARLAEVVTRYHLLSHKLDTLRPGTTLKLLKSLKAFSANDMVEPFLHACEADARGRLGFEDIPYPLKAWLLGLVEHLKTLSTTELMAEGFTGKQLGEEIDRRRLQMIAEYKKTHNVPRN